MCSQTKPGRIFKMQFVFTTSISLAPGFSPVLDRCERHSRFNGFFARAEAAEAAEPAWLPRDTGLKPGANQRETSPNDLENTP
ncbi:MAG TPA: hypothetical protein DCQ92_02005 [Verrucomicrobia subdivision 3 bacterium]|nr:hypothetical protein [Limisphaerales bacterium]